MKTILIIVSIFLTTIIVQAAGLVFTFANGTFTGTSPQYYEFDVLLTADAAGTRLGDNLVYLNYDTEGFGSSIVSAGKTEITKLTLLEGGSAPSFYYTILNVADNTDSRMAITSVYNYPEYPEYGNEVPTVPTPLLHVKIEVLDENKITISFEQPLMVGQQYESDNTTKYDPITAGDVISDIEQSSSGFDKPEYFKLKQNYPNPFNPSTKLEFEVPQFTENLELAIYNMIGQKVITLHEGSKNVGRYTASWDGTNFAGQPMPSGVYFATMRTEDYVKNVKVMLIK